MNNTISLKNLRIIVLDLDGTLLDDTGRIGDETKSLVKELQKRDVIFSFASGRLHSAITVFAAELQITSPLISLDGTLIKNHPAGEVIFESVIKSKYVTRALEYASALTTNVALCHADAIYYTQDNAVIPQIMDKFGARYEAVNSYDNYSSGTLEIVFAGDNRSAIRYLEEKMMFPYSLGLSTAFFSSQSHEGIFYLEVRRSGSSKGKGLMRLLKYYNLKASESAVIGDWYNDISLFETRAYKVAVANAVPEIKKKANHITERTNNQDGVAEFLKAVLRAKTKK